MENSRPRTPIDQPITTNNGQEATLAPKKPKKGTVNNPINKPVCKRAKIAPKAPPAEMPSRCGSASGFRVTACKQAPTIAKPEPTISASSALGKRISQTIDSLPLLQESSIISGYNLFNRIPQTVPNLIETAPTQIAIEREKISVITPTKKIENTFHPLKAEVISVSLSINKLISPKGLSKSFNSTYISWSRCSFNIL